MTKAVDRLKKSLDPQSEVHRQQSVEELSRHIKALRDLSEQVPVKVSQEWEWDLNIAMKGIVQAKRPPKKQTKPVDIGSLVNWAKVETAPQPKSTLRAEAAPFTPAWFFMADVNAEEDDNEEDYYYADDSAAQKEEDAGIDPNIDLDTARVEQTFAPPSPEEIAAAKCIASMYQQLLSHRRSMSKKDLPAARFRWFVACQGLSEDMDTPYRLLFLGPFPHALVCLEKLSAHAISAKKKAYLRFRNAPQDVYEKVKAEVDGAV